MCNFEGARICPSIRRVKASALPLAATPATLNCGDTTFPLAWPGSPSPDRELVLKQRSAVPSRSSRISPMTRKMKAMSLSSSSPSAASRPARERAGTSI